MRRSLDGFGADAARAGDRGMLAIIALVVCSAFVAGAGFGMAVGLVMGQTKDTLHYLSEHNRRMQEKVR